MALSPRSPSPMNPGAWTSDQIPWSMNALDAGTASTIAIGPDGAIVSTNQMIAAAQRQMRHLVKLQSTPVLKPLGLLQISEQVYHAPVVIRGKNAVFKSVLKYQNSPPIPRSRYYWLKELVHYSSPSPPIAPPRP